MIQMGARTHILTKMFQMGTPTPGFIFHVRHISYWISYQPCDSSFMFASVKLLIKSV